MRRRRDMTSVDGSTWVPSGDGFSEVKRRRMKCQSDEILKRKIPFVESQP